MDQTIIEGEDTSPAQHPTKGKVSMSIFNRISKNTNQPDEDHSSLFLIVVAGAAMLLTCFLIYALVAPTLFDDNPPEYEVVPYSTETPQPAQPVAYTGLAAPCSGAVAAAAPTSL